MSNYIKGRKAFTTYNNKTSTQRQFKTGVPQGGVLSPTLFNIYTSDIPSPPPNINITVYADDITMTSTDTNKQIAQAKLQPYLQEIASWTQQNQLHLNPDKTTSTLFTPDPAEYSTQLTLNIDNVVIPTVKNPKILGLTFDPKLTYNSHIRKTSDKARNTLKLLKALTSTKWGKQKETIVATYKAITRPILEYASTIWSPIASTTGITKLQTIQNMALRIATGCTSDTNIQHLHNETNILPLNAHLKLHSSQLRQKSQHPTHPLHKFTVLTENERHKKQTIFDNNNNYTVNINTKSDLICEDLIQSNLKLIHSHIVSNHLSQRPPNKVLQDQTPSVSPAELLLSRETRRTLAQLRTNKSPLLVSYLFSIGDPRHPSPLCPLCLMHDHTSSHLFECKSLPTSLSSLDLWTNPDKVEPFLATWGERLLAATWFRVLDSAGSTLVEWGRQQQQQILMFWLKWELVKLVGFTWILWTTESDRLMFWLKWELVKLVGFTWILWTTESDRLMFWLRSVLVKLVGFTWILWTTERDTNVLTEVGVSEVGRIHLNLVNNRER